MAGAEKTGVAAARANLFAGSVCVITPTRKSKPEALRKVERLWKSVGGRVLRLTPDLHDSLVSRSSHLPYVLAATLANYVLKPGHPEHQAALCATGFRDTTRIASGSPEMWRDIALANRRNLAKAVDDFARDLQKLRRRLGKGDTGRITSLFEQAKRRRDGWCDRCALPASE